MEQLRARIGAMLAYVGRLQRRMQLRGWPADDPLYADVAGAEKVLHELHVRLIDLAAPQGTAVRPASPAQPDRRPWEPGGSGTV